MSSRSTSTSPTSTTEGSRASVVALLLPDRVTGWVRAMAWASMIANALLIVTGGAVRLTASGLGCPTWPRCTPESWTNTPEMGIHGYIEFGNRLLTFVLVGIAILTLLSLVRQVRRRPLLFWLALLLALGIPVQAVIGGITVRTGLNPWIVGIHFAVSAVLISLAAVLVNQVRRISLPHVAEAERRGQVGGRDRAWVLMLAGVIAVSGAAAIYVGTLVTGTGPHSGDAGEVARHAFDPYVIARVHAAPVYTLTAAAVVALVWAFSSAAPRPVRRLLLVLAALIAAQAAIGYYQFFNGVPELAVWFHMAGSAALAAVITMTVEKMIVTARRAPRPVAPGPRRPGEHALV